METAQAMAVAKPARSAVNATNLQRHVYQAEIEVFIVPTHNGNLIVLTKSSLSELCTNIKAIINYLYKHWETTQKQ